MSVFTSIDDVQNKLSEHGSRALATVFFVADEGSGFGKTEIAPPF